MKKIIISLVALVAVFSFSGCAKQCHCVDTVDGKVVLDYTLDKADGERCDKNDTYVEALGHSTGHKCSSQLF